MADKRLAYDVVSRRLTAGVKVCARFTCAVCAHEDFKTMPADGNNPEQVCKWFERDGWQTSINNRRKVRCPAHAGKRLRHHRPHKENPVMNAPVTPLKPLATLGLPPSAGAALTNEQRGRIRSLLDKHFDDGTGRYLDGYTDQRVGEQLGIPWALVKQVREAAYGDLRGDPEIEALRRMIDGAQKNAETLKGALAKVSDEIAIAQARLVTVETRLGLKA